MHPVLVYSGPNCPYCVKAKALLTRKGAPFTEIDVKADPNALADMMAKSGGRRTIPQIFIGTQHIGGCDDLYALDAAGKLDAVLTG